MLANRRIRFAVLGQGQRRLESLRILAGMLKVAGTYVGAKLNLIITGGWLR